MMMLTTAFVASVCHNVNKSYCESIGDFSQPTWDEAPQWQKNSAIRGVVFHLTSTRQPQDSHENWAKEKLADGWVYGEVKDPDKKTHPCLVPYGLLPVEQQTKDYLFKSVVDSLKPLVRY